MRTDDQWFQPGDKIMLVSHKTYGEVAKDYKGAKPKMGVIYCVEDFFEGPQFNVVMLVGFGGWHWEGNYKCGWFAGNFRKVEEIKLCVQALNKEPITEQL